eukprot:CAMPEP_0181114082 /NCGR_PEP_ID=MMETSP1071-20121207/20689_1 /TAXON_ID=35127 /ORGANISM="Thalassiosira sp., Strain NH16" /LENGTH=82 /DNA_ID=CAMNT_0023198159 /DNA_START=1189 /DNA_END=1438 /DNA_ORIENTATION=-
MGEQMNPIEPAQFAAVYADLSISDMQNTASSPPNWFVRMGTPIYADDLAGPPPMQGRGRQKKLPTPCQRQVSIASYVTSTAA